MNEYDAIPTKIAYLDCTAGISGDMLLGGLIDVGVPVEVLNQALRSLGLPNVGIVAQETSRCGIRAQKVEVLVEPGASQHHGDRHHNDSHHHHHRHLPEILDRIHAAADLTDRAKRIASRLFERLGQAEAKVHGVPIDQIHFHEVGAEDSIADIVGVAVGIDYLNLDRIFASPVSLGSGTIEIAHGVSPVPAPATAELLRGIPIAMSLAEAELTTPTGAAILAELVSEFGPMPPMVLEKVGYGAGSHDFTSHPNVLQVTIGRTDAITSPTKSYNGSHGESRYGTVETVWTLETNLDDTPGEAIGYCIERCWTAGALDVFTIPIQMKKSRPGVLLSVICDEASMPTLERILFEETTTLGVRRCPWTRRVLERRPVEVPTSFGPIRGKVATLPDGTERFSPEFDACRAAAEASGVPLQQIYTAACKAFGGYSSDEKR